jgi:REP element-mobilizing transposase RayT
VLDTYSLTRARFTANIFPFKTQIKAGKSITHTFSQNVQHIVWSTKDRHPLIDLNYQNRLYAYIGGIIRREKGTVISIGGIPYHIHILAIIPPIVAISNLIKTIKVSSTNWINDIISLGVPFSWQRGFGTFSVSKSNISEVKKYIENQSEHHKKHTFREEFIGLLNAHGIDFEKKYLWK